LGKNKGRINSEGVYHWAEQDFEQLYPEAPAITTASTFFIVGLNYRGTLLKVKLPTGIENKNLPYIFHQEIFRYLLNMRDSNPLLKTAQVVGFESIDHDVLLDFQISIGQGVLVRKASFNCLEFVGEGRLKKYKICKCLAIGGFSKVYLVRSLRDGQFYAMKVMLKRFISENQKENII
jgi:serine/threonine protein kinase